jgi:alpha-tubulin suppressor-like RCC1 family protein
MFSSPEYKKKPDQGFVGATVAAGDWHTCAIKIDGSLWCWGLNQFGQLGDGTNQSKGIPVKIISSGVVAVAAGLYHTCAIKEYGSLWCWGNNGWGQIGDGTNQSKNITFNIIIDKSKYTPVQIISSGVKAVAAGGWHTCAIKIDGSLWCWGLNQYGQLGDGTKEDKYTPVQIISSGVKAVAAGGVYTCAIKEDGSLWCWGWNEDGQLQIIESGVVAVAAGRFHTCAIKEDGSLRCWGRRLLR